MGKAPAFNLSRSGDRCVIAVSWQHQVGIDVEAIRDLGNVCGLATYLPRHLAKWVEEGSNHDVMTERFLRAWTAVEAYCKAIGVGLRVPPQSAPLVWGAGGPVAAAQMDGTAWRFHEFAPWPGFVSTVALISEGPQPDPRPGHQLLENGSEWFRH